jgi:hypothetical protein
VFFCFQPFSIFQKLHLGSSWDSDEPERALQFSVCIRDLLDREHGSAPATLGLTTPPQKQKGPLISQWPFIVVSL